MDKNDFDSLTKAIAKLTSRRIVFRGAAATMLGGVLAKLGASEADAQRRPSRAACRPVGASCRARRGRPRPQCCGGSRCNGRTCECRGGLKKCGKDCIRRNQCCRNNECPNNQRCIDNRCGCPKRLQRCAGRCIPDNKCCRDNQCGAGEVCNAQHNCVAQTCTANAQCASGVCACGDNASGGTCQPTVFLQTFAENVDGWLAQTQNGDGPASLAISQINGVALVKAGNSYDPDFDPTAFSRLGGYSQVFPNGGYDVSLDVFLNLDDTRPDTGFAYTVASNRSDTCAHKRDFAFNVGTSDDGTQYCVRFAFGVHTNNTIGACTDDHEVLDGASGWYRFVHQFRNESGVLAVTMLVLDPSGTVVAERTLSSAQDTMDIVGGNRYAWLSLVKVPEGILIDNSARANL